MLFSKTGPSEMRFEAPSACRNRMYVLPPDGRTLTPRLGIRLSQTENSRAPGRRRAMAASVNKMMNQGSQIRVAFRNT